MAGKPSQIELLRAAPPGIAPFVLAVEAAGDRYFVPYLRTHALWEPAETLTLLRILRAGMQVVDVGAHVGYYSLLMSRCVGAAGAVMAFEPEPDNHRLLQANLLLNDCRNVRARQQAAAAQDGQALLHLSDDNLGDHRLQPVAGRRTVAVETVTLDAALGDFAPDFVKIDTQGAEPQVLRGMHRTIERQRDRLACLFEFAPGLLARVGIDVARFAALLSDFGARVYRPSLRDRLVVLQRLGDLPAALAGIATELAKWNEEDASIDLLAFFSAAAEADWLARFRGA